MAIPYVPYTGPIVTRAEAKARGLKRYFNGMPCPQSHLSERFVSTGTCHQCLRDLRARYYHAHPERRPAALSYGRAWSKANPEKVKAAAKRAAAKAGREPFRARNRKYEKAHPEKALAKTRNRRARLRNSKGQHTASQIQAMLEYQRHKCPNCRVSLKRGYHVDHIVPIALGGSNGIENIQLLCGPCNQTKHAKDPITWAQENGRLL